MLRNAKLSIGSALLSGMICSAALAQVSLKDQTATATVGGVRRLEASGATPEKLHWQTSDPTIAAVYGNGFVVGLREGSVTVRVSVDNASPASCTMEVVEDQPVVADPAGLKQFDDNRTFRIDGRRCFGSELNGQRAVGDAERQYTDSNRVINPEPLVANRPLEWEVESGAEIYGGAGTLMGTVAPRLKLDNGKRVPAAKFNFGMSKVLHGKLCVYAFATPIIPDKTIAALVDPNEIEDGAVGTSAWLPLDRVIHKDELVPRIGLGSIKLPALPLKEQTYKITGGDPKMYFTDAGECAIVKTVRENNAVPSHYLKRPSGTVNVLYSVPGFGLGGQGLDSFLVTGHITFRPAVGAREFVQPTYFPLRHPKKGEVSPMTMTFVYGAVEGHGMTPVYGWIAKEALSGEH